MNLQEMGELFKADKASVQVNGVTYYDIYERYFEPIRMNPLCVLELGVKQGGSLLTWQEYFPNARILGVDIDPAAKQVAGPRITVFNCSQDDVVSLEAIAACGCFDIVLDDASHINQLTIASFNILYKYVKPGGFYILEDMGCSYNGDMRIQVKEGAWPGMQYNKPDINWNNNREDIDALLHDLIFQMDRGGGAWQYIHFYPMTIVMRKW